MYNGNIAAMGVNVPKIGEPLLYTYTYDQLNGITKMFTYKGLNLNTNSWNVSAFQDYREQVSYDANGNIKTYKRNGDAARSNASSSGMDNLTYSYKPGTNQLDKVVDAAPDAAAGEYDKYNDIKRGQQDGNYQYDEIGNLIKDVSEKIENITWTVYGKLNTLTKADGTIITYTYDASGNRISKSVKDKETVYVRDASGNVLSIYSRDALVNNGDLTQTEIHLYGSSRLGVYNLKNNVQQKEPNPGRIPTFTRRNKFFELSNHLGNVLATVSDKGLQHSMGNATIDHFEADAVSAQDYYPFGMIMPGRKYSAANTNYRYGFNGKEKDKEATETTTYDYGFRIYNPGLGRFLSVDPLTKKYAELTPYQFASNSPIAAIDLDGKEAWIAIYKTYDDKTTKFQMVFDKDVENPGGVYVIHRYFTAAPDGSQHLTFQRSGSENYSAYYQQFPNFSKGVRDQFSFKELAKSFNLEGKLAGGGLGGSFGANGKLIGINFDFKDSKGVPLIGWNSTFRKGDGKLEVGGGLSYGVGLENKQKFDVNNGTFTPDNEIKYNGLVTSGSVNTNSKDVKLSWNYGLKAAIGYGFNVEGKFEINVTQLSKALKPLSIKFSEYEKRELKAEESSKKQEFNADNY